MDENNQKWEEEELPKMEAAWVDKELNGNYPEGKEWWMGQMRSHFFDNAHFENVLFLDDWVRDGPFYVVEYSSSQCYGGPEEGGCYGTVTQMNRWTILGDYEKAKALVEVLNADSVEIRNSDAWKMLGGDETVNSTYPEGYIPTGWSDSSRRSYHLEHFPGINAHNGLAGGWDGDGY